ncbi:MAG: hypothetical protein RL088_4249 [Verrucomicrobiota bacterium]|jgi:autotransporter-associated beta strand protein
MISSKPSCILTSSIAALAALTLSQPSRTEAASGNWNVDAAGNWSATANWTPAAVPGTAAGDVVSFINDITAARTVTIDTTSRRVGDLNIGDSTTTLFGFTIAASGGAVLNLDGTGFNDATVDFTAAIANTISAPLTLVDNAIFRSNVNAVQTISGVISGVGKSVTFNNDTDGASNAAVALQGQFTVSGANTYDSGSTISDVRVNITNNTALGSGLVTVQSGGQVFASTALTNVANNFRIAGDGWAETTAGQPLGALRVEGAATLTGNIVMTANAAIGGNSTATNTIAGVVAGPFTLSKRGTGTITLSGSNIYTGGTAINNGALILANNNAAGTGTITLNAGGATSATRLLINGGVAIGNAVTITGNIFGVAGQGSLQQNGTGQARINGAITINGTPSAGGHFVGGASAGNELILAGPITASVNLSQRDGFVRYLGGGTGYTSLTVTNTAQVGATNGISTAATLQLGGSANALLDLNGFNQTLAAVNLGNAGANSPIRGSIALGGQTLSLNGDLSTLNTGTGNATHSVTATAGGGIDFGATARSISVADSNAMDDLQMVGATISGPGGVTKTGAGTLALAGVTLNGSFTVSTGTLRTGTNSQVGSITANNVTFGNGTTLAMKVGVNGDSINIGTGTLTNAGTTNLVLNQLGGALANGTYNLINYTASSPGLAGFSLAPVGHATASLIDTGTAIALNVTGNDQVIWDGTNTGGWATGATGNWKLGSTLAGTDYVEGDDVLFQDGPANATANITADVSPANVEFTNSLSTPITIAGPAGIIGHTRISKTGNGVLNFGGVHQYGGATALLAGTTNLTGSLSGTSISIANGATFNNSGTIANAVLTVAGSGSMTNTGTISGTTSIASSGGTILRGPGTYTGATNILAGTLELDHDGGTMTSSSGVSIAPGATLLLTRDGTGTAATTTFSRTLSGNGNLDINMRTAAGTTAADTVTFSANNTSFSGPIRLLAPAQGTYRLSLTAPTQPGTGTIEVQNGAQIFASGGATYTNSISIAGTGFADSAGNIGALRLDGSTWAGNISVVGTARIGSHNSTGTITGSISGGDVEFQRTNFNNAYTTILTGTNTYGATTIGGLNVQTAAVPSYRLNIGAGSTTGTLGTGPVTINGDGANGVLGFDRSDGYTLALGQTITGASGSGTIADSIRRTFIDFDTLGTGFDNAGNSITLGTTTSGGNLRFGQTRANTVTNLAGNITAQNFNVGSNAPAATVNLNNTANVTVDFVQLGLGASINVANTLNINNGASVTAGRLFAGQVSGGIGIINQFAGSTVNVDAQLRMGHFPNNTSIYNLAGGSLTLTGASPDLTPSTAAAGGAGTAGDNNINGLATATILGGGVYLGNDGTGIMNHSGGTLTTNWIVLDNRGASGGGTNMPDGIDRYNISGNALLKFRSSWGMLGRNETSYAVSFGGGTIQVDNTGAGTGTGPAINVPLDATIDTVTSTTTTLDTVLAANAFTFTKDVRGTGTLAVTGGGTVNFSTTGTQNISASISGSSSLTKIGNGTTTLSGSSTAYTGTITVSGGRLNLTGTIGGGASVLVADGAAFSSEQALGTLTLGNTTGSTLFFDPSTPGKLTVNTLNVMSNTVLDFSGVLPGDGTYPVLGFTSRTGLGTFALASAGNFRSALVNESATTVDVTISNTKSLIWNGIGGTVWDLNLTANWEDSATPGLQEKFFMADVVSFGDADANGNAFTPPTAVTVSPGVAPALVQVSGTVNNYTFTSSGAGIAGGEIVKDGSTTLTLIGANTYPGKTTINSGTVSIADPASLGNGSPGNSVFLGNGGRLAYTGAVAANLGFNRNINVGSGGGTISHSNAAAATIAIPGKLLGSGTLSLNSTLAGNGTFSLTGMNGDFSGTIVVDSLAAGLTTLSIPNQSAVPAATSITLNYPPAGATGNATTINLLGGVTLPATTTLKMTSLQNGTTSLRSQITTSGDVTIDSPITLSGSAIIQVSPGAGSTITLNGPISAGVGGFTGANAVFFLRGTGSGILNGTINLPGANLSHTDAAPWIINSTGNVWAFTGILSTGVVRLGANNALATGAILSIGQASDAANSLLEMNGFSQEVNGLTWIAGSASSSRGVGNSSTTPATLTLNSATDYTFGSSTGITGGSITGNISIVKNGTNTQTLAGLGNSYTGNVTVNSGTLVAGGSNLSTALGNPAIPGRTVTVNNPGSTLRFTTSGVFGTGFGNNNLPTITLNLGTTLASTRYNVLGALTLNGATLTQSSTDSGAYEGLQFRGGVTVGGNIQSIIESPNNAANHLATNTVFNVADVIAGIDLLVTAPLRDQSGDFGTLPGALTKTGPGAMELVATSSYTGATLVNDGLLRVSGSITGSTVTVEGSSASLGGSGTVGPTSVLNGGTINPGVTTGILSTIGSFSMTAGTFLVSEINGLVLGADYDQLNVAGAVALGNATLSLGGTYTGIADIFTLIVNDGSADPVSGTFAGLPEGAPVFAAGTGQQYTISYVGGDGNDVTLTAVPEPGSAAMLLAGTGLLVGIRRRKRSV